jgi:hypothetical protein
MALALQRRKLKPIITNPTNPLQNAWGEELLSLKLKQGITKQTGEQSRAKQSRAE